MDYHNKTEPDPSLTRRRPLLRLLSLALAITSIVTLTVVTSSHVSADTASCPQNSQVAGASSNDGRECEQGLVGATPEQRLNDAVAKLDNRQGRTELLDEFLRRRSSLTGSDLALYDRYVARYFKALYVNGSDQQNADGKMGRGMSYLLAASFVDVLWSNPSHIEHVLQQNRGDVRILVDLPFEGFRGVNFCRDGRTNGSIAFADGVVEAYLLDTSDAEIVLHELIHALECHVDPNGNHLVDGRYLHQPAGMTPAQIEIYEAERGRMFEANIERLDFGGLTRYTFWNHREFWAEASLVVHNGSTIHGGNRDQFRQRNPALYNLLRDYYQLYDLPPA